MRIIYLLTTLLLLAACSTSSGGGGTEEPLQPGDAARGAELFTESVGGAPACSTCHTVDGSTLVGPSMQGYGAVAGTRVEGQSAEEYTHTSIIQPPSFIVSGFSNVMFGQYGQRLSPQQIADLTAYLLTL